MGRSAGLISRSRASISSSVSATSIVVAAWSTGRGGDVELCRAAPFRGRARSGHERHHEAGRRPRPPWDERRIRPSSSTPRPSAAPSPSRCFYEHAARRCGCERGAVLFVDNRHENVEAAIDFGFHGHLHRDPRTLERLLREWNLTGEEG